MDAHKEIELRYRLKGLARELPAKMALIALAPPPPRPALKPEPRKGGALQELLAMKADIRDSFARSRLELGDLSFRLEDFRPAKSVPPAAADAKPEPPQAAPAAVPADLPPHPAQVFDHEPERRAASKPRILALSFLVAGLAAAASYFLPMLSRAQVASFPLPHEQAAGFCRGYGGRLFFADPRRQMLYTLSDEDGQVKSVQPFLVQSLAGLAFDGNYFWSSGLKGISRHEASGQLLETRTFPEAGSAAGPLAWDGKYLWAASPGQGRMVKYLPGETMFLSGNYPLPPSLDAGFFADGEQLYAVEQHPPRLCRYKPDPDMELTGAAPLGRFLPPGARVSGFTLDNAYLWLITDNPQELRRIKREDLAFAGPSK